MQEIHAISGGGRFFGGGGGVGGGGDRRLRPHNHHHQNHQALKCPRCDSLNTKFCYYNNYNLSQPRHFCKNCRRYWTKGGVLRNVPVGGGCRKSKRSNNKAKNSSSETVAAAAATTTSTSHTQPPAEPERKSNSHSSSESSSLTAANTTAAATEAVSAPTSNSDSNTNNNVLDNNMHESKLLIRQSSTPNPLEQAGAGDCGIFSEIGSFTSLINSANEAFAFGFGNNNTSPFRFSAQQGSDLLSGSGAGGGGGEWQQQKVMMSMGGGDHHHHHHQDQDLKLPDITAGSLLDHTVPVDLSALHNKTSLGGFGSLDWHGGADQGLFDLSTNTVDHAYWSHTHWPDHDNPSLFHLP